jgi:hypothetical protein
MEIIITRDGDKTAKLARLLKSIRNNLYIKQYPDIDPRVIHSYYKHNPTNGSIVRLVHDQIYQPNVSMKIPFDFPKETVGKIIEDFNAAYDTNFILNNIITSEDTTVLPKFKYTDVILAKKLITIKENAESRGLEFNLSFKKLKLLMSLKKCQITGIEFDDANRRSIDRIDNSKGYVDDNIAVTTVEINQKKGALSIEEIKQLYAFIKRKKL